MNRRLLDPFQSVELPETIEEFLDDGIAQCIAFNRRGTLLAAGCADGQVVIWDIETRGVAQRCAPHSMPVTSVAWSKDGCMLLSGSLDKCVCLWDLQQNVQEHQMKLDGAVVHVSLHPEPSKCIASFAVGPPVVADFATDTVKPLPAVVMEGEGKNSKPAANHSMMTAIALYDKAGDLIYMGQSKGTVTVLDSVSLKFLDVVKVPGGSRIVSMILNRRGTRLLVNCYDRVVRLYETCQPGKRRRSYTAADLKTRLASAKVTKQGSLVHEDASLKLLREFRNEVERWQWRGVAFSNDDEHVIGASNAKNEHIMYVWNAVVGNLERILEGPKEGALDLLWHPLRSCVVSVSTTGKIYLWAPIYRENWSAFAPDFEELEENREYVEREDEFDINEREEDRLAAAAAANAAGDDGEVDIMTVEDEPFFSSDEEEGQGQQLHYLPVSIHKPLPKPAANLEAGPDDMEEDEEAIPAVRLGNADREPSQSGGDSDAEGLAPSHSGQYDGAGLSTEDGAARGRSVKLKVKLKEPSTRQEGQQEQQTDNQQDVRILGGQKKKRRRQ
ncbi:hypothetical protein WJX79_007507 [Trebouxia sp. C0005]